MKNNTKNEILFYFSPWAAILIVIATLILFPLLFLISFFIATPIIISSPMLAIAHISFPSTGSDCPCGHQCECFFIGLLLAAALVFINYTFISELFFNVNVLGKSFSDKTMSYITKSVIILNVIIATLASIACAIYLVDKYVYSFIHETTKTRITNSFKTLFNTTPTDVTIDQNVDDSSVTLIHNKKIRC